ncbi:MAG: PIN domain-containing protein [Chloroflexi bacterium]|nr:PIN domain-containing protein [Chloroflexota bacterium]
MFVALLAGPAHPLHDAALGLFRRVADGSLALLVTPVIAAELVYVSRSVIGWSRAATAERLGSMLEADGLVVTERAVLRRALALYGERPRLDLADAYLAAAALEVGPPAVASFDADLDGLDGLRRISG